MPLDPATEILIAELHRQGLLDGEALANIAARLDASGEADAAMAVRMVPVANALDTPEVRRSGLHVVTAVTTPTDQS